jgi:hypothetical protein
MDELVAGLAVAIVPCTYQKVKLWFRANDVGISKPVD